VSAETADVTTFKYQNRNVHCDADKNVSAHFFPFSYSVCWCYGVWVRWCRRQLNSTSFSNWVRPFLLSNAWSTSLRDLGLALPPQYFGLMVAGDPLYLHWPVAAGLGRIFKPWRRPCWFALAGGVGASGVAFRVTDHFAPMPTFIAATREAWSACLMLAGVAVGIGYYGRLTRRSSGVACA